MKVILFLARIITGLVFVFSGFVKAIDPMGSAIKFEEYFMAFKLEFLTFLSLPLAILLSSAELMIGLSLLVKVRMKFTSWLLLVFMSFFTLLTLLSALTNPVSDCGCFGDAVKLTNWQTFGKNIILLVPTLIVFLYRKQYKPLASQFTEWYLTGVNFILPVIISVFCLVHQPVLDFRPYTPGTSIPEKMTLPEGTPTDVYETILIYEKDGVQKEFTETNFPWQDTTWKWVETKQDLVKKGEEPPIHDFSITTLQGEDITSNVLSDTGTVFLIIAPKLENASQKGRTMMNELAMKALNTGFTVYCLTASATTGVDNFIRNFRPAFDICTTDETTLKTIIRANPGLMIISKGTILGKWNFRDAPLPGELKKNLLPVLLTNHYRMIEKLTVVVIILIIALFYAAFFRAFIPRDYQSDIPA